MHPQTTNFSFPILNTCPVLSNTNFPLRLHPKPLSRLLQAVRCLCRPTKPNSQNVHEGSPQPPPGVQLTGH